jgi:Ulp1 family protease
MMLPQNARQTSYSIVNVVSTGEDIFQLDKLLILVDVPCADGTCHWTLFCCHMSSKTIYGYDTDSVRTDSGDDLEKEAKRIVQYLLEEELVRTSVDGNVQLQKKYVDGKNPWKIKVKKDVPQQSVTSKDCAVFICLFMDFLLLDLPLSQLTQENIREYGRKWLFMSICCDEILLDKI